MRQYKGYYNYIIACFTQFKKSSLCSAVEVPGCLSPVGLPLPAKPKGVFILNLVMIIPLRETSKIKVISEGWPQMVWNDAQESVFLKSCPSASSDEPELLDACVTFFFL